MDNETKEMLQMILQGMEKMEQNLRKEIADTKSEIAQTNTGINQHFTKLETKIENDVTSRIKSLFDGFVSNHERQEELAQKVEEHERRIDRLETRAGS